jgi:hypothetical protein
LEADTVVVCDKGEGMREADCGVGADAVDSCFIMDLFFCASLVIAALLLRGFESSEALPEAEDLWVLSCCFILSFLVNALLQTGQ